MTTHPSILAWKIPWTEEPSGLHSIGSKESNMTENIHIHTHTLSLSLSLCYKRIQLRKSQMEEMERAKYGEKGMGLPGSPVESPSHHLHKSTNVESL